MAFADSHLYSFTDLEIAQDIDMKPIEKLDKLTHLAEMCVDLIQENNEHYGEVC